MVVPPNGAKNAALLVSVDLIEGCGVLPNDLVTLIQRNSGKLLAMVSWLCGHVEVARKVSCPKDIFAADKVSGLREA
jgi:hypothetical protein